ncbi:MAG: right-handed parallel beta-helix repeat-containing protein [Ignavibacteria bacterium]
MQSRVFFISNTGDDSNSGTSENNAWRTIQKVSSFKFKPGDIIQFRGGDLFTGNLLFNDEEGTETDPIEITSYGFGSAILQCNSDNCITIINKGGFLIHNLEIKGIYDPDIHYSKKHNKGYNGIVIFTYGKKTSPLITIKNCVLRNFKDNAISIGGDSKSKSGYSIITVVNNLIYDCGDIGIKFWGLQYNKILISGNTIYNIKGVNPHLHGFSGNGISMSHIYGAEIERNLIYNNGKYAKHSGGGIVTGESRSIIVRYNEIYGIKSNDVDGDAIDFDNGSDSCIAEYNYTHQNDGAGVLISGENKGSGSDNNIVRYNISKNDGLKNDLGAVQIYSLVGADNNRIYNNTIISTAIGKNSPACFKIQGSTTNTFFENNILITVNSALFINIDVTEQTNLIVRSNSYFHKDGIFAIIWGRKVYKSYENFIKGTGQEFFNSIETGILGNPQLKNPLTNIDTVNNAYKIDTLSSYKLYSFSPLINKGTNIQSVFLEAEKDFYGSNLTLENPPDIGAHEY